MSDRAWYVDACSLINLCASGLIYHVAHDLGLALSVIPKVYPGESTYLYDRDSQGRRGERSGLSIDPLFASGVLVKQEDPTTEPELGRFVLYSTLLDDGEAATLAVAECRGSGIITDDFAAFRVAREHAPEIEALTTYDLIYRLQEAGTPVSLVKRAIESIEIRARYVPSPRHHLYAWVQDILSVDD